MSVRARFVSFIADEVADTHFKACFLLTSIGIAVVGGSSSVAVSMAVNSQPSGLLGFAGATVLAAVASVLCVSAVVSLLSLIGLVFSTMDEVDLRPRIATLLLALPYGIVIPFCVIFIACSLVLVFFSLHEDYY